MVFKKKSPIPEGVIVYSKFINFITGILNMDCMEIIYNVGMIFVQKGEFFYLFNWVLFHPLPLLLIISITKVISIISYISKISVRVTYIWVHFELKTFQIGY